MKNRKDAALSTGVIVRLVIPGDDSNGLRAKITKPYGQHQVVDADGRKRRRLGYYVSIPGERGRYFVTAGQVAPIGEQRKAGHLVVAVDNGIPRNI